MRVLGLGDSCDLASMYLGLARRGHAVRVHVRDPAFHGVHAGLLARTDDWQRELGWLRAAGDDHLVLVETADLGAVQDSLRAEGFRVVGGSAFGDCLEADRSLGQQVLRDAGLRTAACHRFTDHAAAMAFVRTHPRRWVLKHNGAAGERTRNLVGTLDDGRDVLAVLGLLARRQPPGEAVDFVLMEHLAGIEVGVGAFFDGVRFLQPAVVDFEHKRLFPGELGELTGEMGTVLSYRGARPLFDAVLAPLAPLLREGRYLGWLNVNLIANADGLWPLEFTSRFGYPGYAICEALHLQPWEALFERLLRQDGPAWFATRPGFACGIVLTLPPFPWRPADPLEAAGLPVCLRARLDADDRARLAWSEVAQDADGQLLSSGPCGYLGVATGTGASVAQAQRQARRLAGSVALPNLRWRHDIGDRVAGGDWAWLRAAGWIADEAQPAPAGP